MHNCSLGDLSVAAGCHHYYFQKQCEINSSVRHLFLSLLVVSCLMGVFNNLNSLLLFSQSKYNTSKARENLFPFILKTFYQSNLIVTITLFILLLIQDDPYVEISNSSWVDLIRFFFMATLYFEKGLLVYLSVVRAIYFYVPKVIISLNGLYVTYLTIMVLAVLCISMNLPYVFIKGNYRDHIGDYYRQCIYYILACFVTVVSDTLWKFNGSREDIHKKIVRLSETPGMSDPMIEAMSRYIMYSGVLFVTTTCLAILIHIIPATTFTFGMGCLGCPIAMYISWLLMISDAIFNNVLYYIMDAKYRTELKSCISRTIIYMLREQRGNCHGIYCITVNGETTL